MKIPDNRNPYEVIINGVKKTYGAGDTVADDAAVKQIIDNEGLFPPKAPETVLPFIDTVIGEKLNHMEDEIENANNPFIVTLTPTAEDFSGTMDKTVAEINAAYAAGQKIVFRVYSDATKHNDVEVAVVYKDENYAYPSFNVYLIVVSGSAGFDGIIFAHTGTTDNGTKNTYSTTIYPLTPMS